MNLEIKLNRKAQSNLRKAMQNSNVNQTEIPQGQDSFRHFRSKVIQSFHDKITHEYICTLCDQSWYRSSVSGCNSSKYNDVVANLVGGMCNWHKRCSPY